MMNLHALWAYRGFIYGSVQREFHVRYQRSLLGAAWAILNPLALIAVYTLVFSQVMKAKLPGVESVFGYSIFLCAGLLTWGFFSEICNRNINLFIENASLLKKVSFPRVALPVVGMLSAVINFLIVFSIFTVFLIISGTFPGVAFIGVIPILCITALLAQGLGFVLGVLNVFFRDVGQFFGIALQFWFWLTPIVYPLDIIPEKLQSLIYFNPVYSIVSGMQGILVRGEWPNWQILSYPAVLGIFLCIIGLALYRQRASDISDEL